MAAIATTIATQNTRDVERRRVAGKLGLQPLQRPHRRGVLAAEQQRQQRHEQADAHALEHHHEKGARENRGQPSPLRPQKRTESPDDEREFAEMVEGAQPPLGYGISTVKYALDDVVVDKHPRAWALAFYPGTHVRDRGIAAGAVEQAGVIDQDHVPAHGMRQEG